MSIWFTEELHPYYRKGIRVKKVLADGAGKQIDGAVIMFGPGMQTCMRLCEKQKTGKAMRAELVKALIHNRQAAFTNSLRKQRVR